MTDEQILDAIAARLAQANEEQDELFKRPLPDYTVDNEDILIRFRDDVEHLLGQRRVGWRRRFTG